MTPDQLHNNISVKKFQNRYSLNLIDCDIKYYYFLFTTSILWIVIAGF